MALVVLTLVVGGLFVWFGWSSAHGAPFLAGAAFLAYGFFNLVGFL